MVGTYTERAMRCKAILVPFSLALALGACRPDTVDLRYRFEEGATTTYEMTADASASWDIGGPGDGSYRVIFEVSETVESSVADEATVSVTMTPIVIEEEGLPVPGAGARSFVLRVGANGEVLEILEVDGVPASQLDPDILAFIGTYRPPLPLEPIRLRSSWESEQEVSVGSIYQRVITVGTLESLTLHETGPGADIEYSGRGPLEWTTTLPQGNAELTGSATTDSGVVFDLDLGILRVAESRTRGRFEVRVVPTEGSPLTGTLALEMKLAISLDET